MPLNELFPLKNLPARPQRPRQYGVTMMMDKGLSLREVEALLSVSADYIDIVKFGWTTALFTPQLTEKIQLYQQSNIAVYFGGTLFEAFLIRNQLDDYKRMVSHYRLTHIEISDGSTSIPHDQKLSYINSFAKDFTVLSEVGSKDANKEIAPYLWVDSIQKELQAGSWKVITEARESGTVGMYHASGEIRSGLVDEIVHTIKPEQLLFEAPRKEQQVFFIKLLGSNVNLGNVSPNEVLGLETLRLGLRGDTFNTFLAT
ncbi:MAG: phosphosulfolactate synthase [Bacteroidia bacterium]|nr:phosphosulfolactate synthase [Bacteroidia bacterium]